MDEEEEAEEEEEECTGRFFARMTMDRMRSGLEINRMSRLDGDTIWIR